MGNENETVFIVTDFVDGLNLSQWLSNEKFSQTEAVELTITLCNALHYAHSKGVIHRDLTPSNILMDSDGTAFVTDFGIAKRDAVDVTQTRDGRIVGTPAYMSPEQARGEKDVDHRSDIYSIGVVLFELLTGELPFRGNLRMVLHQLLTEDAPSPRRYDASIPRDLETICLKCLEKSPARRYESASGLAEDLSLFLAHRPIKARKISHFQRGLRLCVRRPLAAGLLALLALSLSLGTAVSLYFAFEANNRAAELAQSLSKEQKLRSENLQVVTEKETLIQSLESSNRQIRRAKDVATARSMELQAVLDFFQGNVLSANRPEGFEGGLGVDTSLDRAMEAVEPLIESSFEGQPLVQASIRETLGETFLSRGEPAKAVEQFELAVNLRTRSPGEVGQMLASELRLANALLDAGRLDEAVKSSERCHQQAVESSRSDDLDQVGSNHRTWKCL